MNNKPRYTEGTTRHQIVNLLHITGVITPRSYHLFDRPQHMANVMVKLKKEGVVEKSRNEEVFENLSLSNYRDNLEEYFYDNIPDENIDYFEEFGKRDLKRAKYNQKEKSGNSQRIIRSGEIITLMYSAGIPTLPSDKKYVVKNKVLTDNVYYQSREIKLYAGYKDEIKESAESDAERTLISTRINGTLLSAGGNYNIYHIGRDIQTWSTQGEYKIKNFIENMLANYINKDSCELNKAILFTYDLNIFTRLIEPSKKLRSRYEGLEMSYPNLYALPYDRFGKEMIKIMTESDWEYKLKYLIMEEEPQDTSTEEVVCDYVDNGVYTLLFCIPNISKFLDFVRKAAFVKNKEKFQIICFDYQLDFVKNSAGRFVEIAQASFNEILTDWKNKRFK